MWYTEHEIKNLKVKSGESALLVELRGPPPPPLFPPFPCPFSLFHSLIGYFASKMFSVAFPPHLILCFSPDGLRKMRSERGITG